MPKITKLMNNHHGKWKIYSIIFKASVILELAFIILGNVGFYTWWDKASVWIIYIYICIVQYLSQKALKQYRGSWELTGFLPLSMSPSFEMVDLKLNVLIAWRRTNSMMSACPLHKYCQGCCSVTSSSALLSCRPAARSLPSHGFRQLLQSLLQLQGELLIALLTHRLHVKLHKLVPVGGKQWFTVGMQVCCLCGSTVRWDLVTRWSVCSDVWPPSAYIKYPDAIIKNQYCRFKSLKIVKSFLF